MITANNMWIYMFHLPHYFKKRRQKFYFEEIVHALSTRVNITVFFFIQPFSTKP